MKTFIFACVHNAGRSQMAAAFFNQLADSKFSRAISAGTEPAAHINPVVIEAMNELGMSLTGIKPQKLTIELCKGATQLFTLGCKENCPVVPGLKVEDWPFEDPKGKNLPAVRKIRDQIQMKVKELLTQKGLI